MPKEENGLLSIISQSDIAWITANFQNIEVINQYGQGPVDNLLITNPFVVGNWYVLYNLHEA